jgi:hypothetical protein
MDDSELQHVYDVVPVKDTSQEKQTSLEDLNWRKAILIPAGEESRKPVRILPKPRYIKVNHGFRVWDFEGGGLMNPRTPDIYYAVYAFGIFDDTDSEKPAQVRLLRFPVVNDDDATGVNDEIFRELSEQTGQHEPILRRASNPRDIQAIVWNAAHRIHRSLRWIIDPRTNIATKGRNYDCLEDSPDLDAAIFSGWKDGDGLIQPNTNLVAIARAPGGSDWYIDISEEDEIGKSDLTGNIISPPLPDDLSNISDDDRELIIGLVKANK